MKGGLRDGLKPQQSHYEARVAQRSVERCSALPSGSHAQASNTLAPHDGEAAARHEDPAVRVDEGLGVREVSDGIEPSLAQLHPCQSGIRGAEEHVARGALAAQRAEP